MFPKSFHEIPEGMRVPLLMQVAMAKQGGGYGRGGSPPIMSSLAARQADAYARKAMRRDDARDAMQYSMERAAWRGGMPMGGGATAMPSVPGVSQFQPFQNAAVNDHRDQQATYNLLDQLRGGQPVDPQILRNQGLKQLFQSGQLAQDAAGMNSLTPTGQHQWDLEMAGAIAPKESTSIDIGPTQLLAQKAADAVANDLGQPTSWQQSPIGAATGVAEDYSLTDLAGALGARIRDKASTPAGLPALRTTAPQLDDKALTAIREELARKNAEAALTATKDAPAVPYYTPGQRPMGAAPDVAAGLSLLDLLTSNPNANMNDVLQHYLKIAGAPDAAALQAQSKMAESMVPALTSPMGSPIPAQPMQPYRPDLFPFLSEHLGSPNAASPPVPVKKGWLEWLFDSTAPAAPVHAVPPLNLTPSYRQP